MMSSRGRFLLASFLIWIPLQSRISNAQVSVQSLSVARYGTLPNTNEGNNPSYYSDLLIEYRRDWLRAGLRGEGFGSSEFENGYQHISQRYAEISYEWAEVRAGNFYGAFGQGIILRSFELPGFVYESRVFRTQQRIVRDIDGLKITLRPGPLEVTALAGTPVDPLLPPENDARRTGDVVGGQAKINLPGAVSIGAAYLEHETTFRSKLATYFASWTADALLQKIGLPSATLDLSGEYATDNGFGKAASFDLESPHALYLSGNFTINTVGGSFEYKDYRSFDFGINDPPPLIRENAEYLLNRSTHVLDASAEQGVQMELYFSPNSHWRFLGNYSRARNNFGENLKPLFEERYLGIEYLGGPWFVRAFADGGKDELFSEVERFTTGVSPEYQFYNGTAMGMDIQWQRIRRASLPFFDYDFTNLYLAARVLNWKKFTTALGVERSSDPDITESSKYFLNLSLIWKPISQIDLQLFAGKRRGGTACDHGYCIEVLDFEGLEFRMETRW
jgi:hypothetical protein